ncbi:restriction endonuclease [Salinispora sp. H7-4]|uniref:restriction system modified-DNA reader domain-containing protein n=1 Tax=Salinispora sp. H7-4 TaxID=2748321 RepID=UPI0015D16458|nr:restriction endonuclease [Salinispora sp. H7-4]NYT94089.1 restriction endonuclease [Salinispora sp. H7-4]
MHELREALKECGEVVERFRRGPRRLGEQNTKMSLINPVLEALGWNVRDPDEVSHEYRRNSTDNPVDYALLFPPTPKLLIEAKGLGEKLNDPRWANQTIAYATSAGVEWVALTDGLEWRIYNAHAPVPIEQKLLASVRIDDPEDAVKILILLSKDNIRANRIGRLAKALFVDRQVQAELTSIFNDVEPPAELVALLNQRLPRLTVDEIRTSLTRAHARFDFPALADRRVPLSNAAGSPPSRPSAVPPEAERSGSATTGRATRPTVTSQERRIKVTDMIAAGRLQPGAKLSGAYLDVTHHGELLADGRIQYNGRAYSSLSAAGRAVKLEALGPKALDSTISTDGLGFWHTTDALSGDTVSVKEIRRRIARDSTSRGPADA